MNKRLNRYCVNGHDTFVTGRYKSHRCVRCIRERAGQANRYLPAAPLRREIRRYAKRLIDSANASDLGLRQMARLYANRFDLTEESAERAISRVLSPRNPRITETTADQWCVLMEIHPTALWPKEWPLEMAE